MPKVVIYNRIAGRKTPIHTTGPGRLLPETEDEIVQCLQVRATIIVISC